MFEKEKSKRKGRPRRSRILPITLIILIVLVIVGLFLLLNPTPQPVPAPDQLIAFDISETTDQIALLWMSGAYQTTRTLATRKWSDVKQGTATSNLLAAGPDVDINSLTFQSAGPALVAQKSDEVELRLDGHTLSKRISQLLTSTLSPSGNWLAWVKITAANHVLLSRIRQENGENVIPSTPDRDISIDQSPIVAMAISADDKLLAVATASDRNMHFYVTLIDIAQEKAIRQFDLPEGQISDLVFRPDSRELAIEIAATVYRLNTDTGSIQPLLIITPIGIQQFGYDPTGRWFVAMGEIGDRAAGESAYGMAVYDLSAETETDPYFLQPPTSSIGVNFRFLKDGIVLGQENNQLTFWQWTGETWDNTATWAVEWS